MNMGKKKKKGGGRRRSYKKKKRSGPKAKPAGLAGGVAMSGFKMATDPDAKGMTIASRIPDMLAGRSTLSDTFATVQQAATNVNNYKYALVGLIVTSSKNIPVLSMVARPADRGLKRLTKGKWGL